MKKKTTYGLWVILMTMVLCTSVFVPASAKESTKTKKTAAKTTAKSADLIQNVKAVGVNGGVRVGWMRVSGAKSYAIKVKDYKGKIHTAQIPDNVNNSYKHEYDHYKYKVGKMIYWDIRKLDHEYNSINSWMNKNNKVYQFRVIAYSDENRQVRMKQSAWVKAVPFNVEKDAPLQDVMLPGKYVDYDPESKADKIVDKSKFAIKNIKEGDRKVTVSWKNKVKDFKVTSYEVKYKPFYNDDAKDKKTAFKVVAASTKKTSVTIKKLKNEQEYLVVITAKGKMGKTEVWMQAEDKVIPHTASSRKARLSQISLGNPYSGDYTLTGWYRKNVAEAYANYGNNGGPFYSNTKYFLWLNMHQLRLYIFTKTTTNEWKLWKDMPCGIGYDQKPTPFGMYVLETKDWVYKFRGLHVQWLTYYTGYYANAIHTETYQTMEPKMLWGKFESAGCVRIDRLWAKWVYEHAEYSTFLIR